MNETPSPESRNEKTEEELKKIEKTLKSGKDDLEDEEAASLNKEEMEHTDEEKLKIKIGEVCFIVLLVLAVVVTIYLLGDSQNWALTLWVGFFKLCIFAILAKKWDVTVFSDLVDKIIQVVGKNANRDK